MKLIVKYLYFEPHKLSVVLNSLNSRSKFIDHARVQCSAALNCHSLIQHVPALIRNRTYVKQTVLIR